MTKLIPMQLENVRQTCGVCWHWREDEDVRGTGSCCALPSSPVLDYEDDVPMLVSVRPCMGAQDWACVYFKANPKAAN